jgi:hypothetical protein
LEKVAKVALLSKHVKSSTEIAFSGDHTVYRSALGRINVYAEASQANMASDGCQDYGNLYILNLVEEDYFSVLD